MKQSLFGSLCMCVPDAPILYLLTTLRTYTWWVAITNTQLIFLPSIYNSTWCTSNIIQQVVIPFVSVYTVIFKPIMHAHTQHNMRWVQDNFYGRRVYQNCFSLGFLSNFIAQWLIRSSNTNGDCNFIQLKVTWYSVLPNNFQHL